MLKKNAWIAALFLALAMVFAGCVEAPIPEGPDLGNYYEVLLGDFNTEAGAPDNQKGWATFGHNEALTQREDLLITDFLSAEYLVLELGSPIAGGFTLIWGTTDKNLGLSNPGWNTRAIFNDQGQLTPGLGVTYEDNILTIDLTKALNEYAKYAAVNLNEAVRIVIQYYSPNVAGLGISKAYLLVPKGEPTSYLVKFDLDGGEYLEETSLASLYVSVDSPTLGSYFPAIHPLKAGSYFLRWEGPDLSEDAEEDDVITYDADTEITADVTLTAVYASGTPATYLVTLELAGGTGITELNYQIVRGQPLGKLGSLRQDGQWFEGWKDEDGNLFDSEKTPILKDGILTAEWTALDLPLVTTGHYLTVIPPDMGNYEFVRTITVVADSIGDANLGKGNVNLVGDLAAIRAALAGEHGEYSFLLLYVTIPPNPPTNPNASRNGYGLGTVGGVSAGFNAPGDVDDHRDNTFLCRVSPAAISGIDALGSFFVNAYNDAIVQKIELWKPNSDFLPPIILEGNAISFTGTGGLSTAAPGRTFNFTAASATKCGIEFDFTTVPNITQYVNIIVNYTVTKLTSGVTTFPMKHTITMDGADKNYPQPASDGAQSWSGAFGSDRVFGISHNTYNGVGGVDIFDPEDEGTYLTSDFTVTITRVTFTQ